MSNDGYITGKLGQNYTELFNLKAIMNLNISFSTAQLVSYSRLGLFKSVLVVLFLTACIISKLKQSEISRPNYHQCQIWLWCMCWQHTVPSTYIKNLTSHLHAIIKTNDFYFDVRFLPISALMSKAIHRSRIRCWVLSVKYAYDLNLTANNGCWKSLLVVFIPIGVQFQLDVVFYWLH